ncbi:MAG: 30S ribosomal protein S20 [Pelagibacterales bacterium]|nr:30S ribosomal protein S20 [Pelagibacterales bacterium]
MANTKAAIKALRSSTKKNEVNSARKNRIRSFVRKVDDAIKAADATKAREAFKALEPEIMRGVTKKIIKLNTAARKLTRLSAAIRKISQKAA